MFSFRVNDLLMKNFLVAALLLAIMLFVGLSLNTPAASAAGATNVTPYCSFANSCKKVGIAVQGSSRITKICLKFGALCSSYSGSGRNVSYYHITLPGRARVNVGRSYPFLIVSRNPRGSVTKSIVRLRVQRNNTI